MGAVYTASPLAADATIYPLNESGEAVVLRAGRKLDILERNDLDERAVASPAPSHGRIFIRTHRHLLCMGKTSE